MKGPAAALALALALSAVEGPAAAQEQPPPRTTFRSAVDLVPVDVSVVDRDGRPVSDQALDVLTEARTLWPADDDVTVRLGTALVPANKSADAVKVLAPYLDLHPADHEMLFVAMRALYEARAAGRAVDTVEADKVRFIEYADAYAAARGSQQPLVDQWRKYVESRR